MNNHLLDIRAKHQDHTNQHGELIYFFRDYLDKHILRKSQLLLAFLTFYKEQTNGLRYPQVADNNTV